MNQDTKDVFEAIAGLTRLSTDLIEMPSIQLDRFLQTTRKRTIFIRKGDMVRVAGATTWAFLVDVDADNGLSATHLILECRGTIYSGNLQVDCENLDTGEVITVKL